MSDIAQLNDAFEQVRSSLGDGVVSDLSERDIRAVLWDSYFDVEQTIGWCLGDYSLNLIVGSFKDY